MALPYDLATMINSLRETCSSLPHPENGSLNTPQARIIEPYMLNPHQRMTQSQLKKLYPNLSKAASNSPPIQFNVFDLVKNDEPTQIEEKPEVSMEFTKGSISTIEEGQSLQSSIRSKKHGIFSRLLRQHTKSDSSDLSLSSGDLEAEEGMVAGSDDEEEEGGEARLAQSENIDEDNDSDQSYAQNPGTIESNLDSELSDDLDSDEFLSDFEYENEGISSPIYDSFSYSKKKSLSLRKKGSESLNIQSRKHKSSSTINEPTLIRNSRSFTNFAAEIPSFGKQTVSKPVVKSNLTSLITAKTETPLDYYLHVSSDSGLAIRIYLKDDTFKESELNLKVNPNASVVEVIGYALRTIQTLDGAKYSILFNPNFWSLYLWDEDEDSYDEFGILSRKRTISSYGADEFALVKCENYRDNEKETPLPFELEDADDEPKLDIDEDYRRLLVSIPDKSVPFSAITLSNKQSSTLHRRDAEDLRHEEIESDDGSLIEVDDDSDEDFNMQPKAKTQAAPRQRRPQLRVHTDLKSTLHADAKTPTTEVLSTGYHRWDVIRRHPFKNRQERSLAVDGTQIYILPFSDNRGSWYENAKTSSFHVSQIVKCKRSSKHPLLFKVVISKNGGLKRYDLEASSAAQCKDIVNKISMTMQAYKAGLSNGVKMY
ncbi:unnamed protein product [Kuraishia capsulata CBS 1993]|uniref:Uncharacterized protein n=1 Tax=Kuraishia capsulata CBS 1993 TaxID=1382522 RepID=W6MXH6_9ASCO|nr:uncharacterized protein KUCA_T00004890001 [Kuraishia capsulata CBS 1993]CDK28905.1 unnamed protein product [Kuraishia capsulata CBS 1993]